MRFLYDALTYLLLPFAFAMVLWRGLRDRRYWAGLEERFGLGVPTGAPSIWVHAVSLGEVNAAAALIRALRKVHPTHSLVLTTATPTGRARAQELFADACNVRYLPYDTPGAMRRFMDLVRPRVAVIMETELWPNLFAECRRRGIPTVLASARLSSTSVSRYQRFGSLFRPVFSGKTLVAAQSDLDAARFVAIGARRNATRVIGNVKFDLTVDQAALDRGRELRAAWGNRPVWIAGSTHAGEEEQVLAAHAELERDALLLLVPRHPERFAAVAQLLRRSGVRFERRSGGGGFGPLGAFPPESQVLLVDTTGELAALYASVDIAFVGGSLVPVGGHNLLEPAALGLPVITGPSFDNGREVAKLLLSRGGALEVADAHELAATVRELIDDPGRRAQIGAEALRVVEENRGSVARLLELVAPML